jgi:hypothetical protein
MSYIALLVLVPGSRTNGIQLQKQNTGLGPYTYNEPGMYVLHRTVGGLTTLLQESMVQENNMPERY